MQATERRTSKTALAGHRFLVVRLVALLAATVVVAGVGVACESAGASDPTPVLKFKITPAPSTYTTTTSATPTVGPVESPSASGNALTLVGQDSTFNETALTARPGAVTITFSNKDGGVVHNLHVFDGTDASGTSIGETDLESGPIDQELKLDLAPGTYYFQCDAHPATMKGTLTVQ